jgi:PQQ-dependent catabolism-associated beta-propeller protein
MTGLRISMHFRASWARSVARLRELSALTPMPLVAGLTATFLAAAPSDGLAKDTGLIFVNSEAANNVVVVDPETNDIIKSLRASRGPRDMHFNADHSRLYVACGDDEVINVIDVGKLEVVGRLATKSSPETFGVDEKRRRVYVANKKDSSLSVIDIDQNVIIHEVPTGTEPEGVFVSEDGKVIYVASEVGDFVHMVDAEDGYVIQDVVVGTRPRRFAATPDEKELWVTAELSGEVYIINRARFAIDDKIGFLPPVVPRTAVMPVDLVITKDGRTAYVALGHAGLVAEVDVRTRKVQGYILGKRAGALAMNRDESTLYVINGFGDDVTVIDMRSRKAAASISVGRTPRAIVIDD